MSDEGNKEDAATGGEATTSTPTVVETEPYVYENDQDTEEFKRSFAANYLVRQKPKSIFVMTLGMPEFAGILDRPPLSIIKRKDLNEAYVPKADDFKQEVKRRAHFFMNVEEEANYFTEELKRNHPLKTRRNKIVMPQPNQWLNTNLKKWLAERPMKPNDKDIEFLQNEVTKALNFLGTESLIDPNESSFLGSPKATPPVLLNLTTPATNTLSLPVLPADEHSYTSVNDTDEFKRSAALTYSKLASKPRVVIAMALGMIEYQGLLDRPPFSTARRKELTDDFMPRAEDYRYEIRRRAHFFMNVDEEADYFTKDLKKKHPLENMRGVVQLPQPAQWKIQALRGWLSERPLRPNKEDSAFIQESMQKIMESLDVVMEREKVKTENSAKKPGMKMPWGTAHAAGAGMGDKDDMLYECLNKQDAVLTAVNKQNKSQTILNKITILNQSIAGYQQEISSLRSTLNDVENRIMTLEMKVAEAPAGAGKLNEMIAEQKGSKDETLGKIKDLQDKIEEHREEIATLTKEMEEMSVVTEDDVSGSRKRKLDETQDTAETMEV
eukprot:CAMPEP_0176044978 /NCGR_PEP_ID=MMETSP0120_2-20121206/22325_1 /TAXON_ID=160619 /ORGANISM="Kryptoperidinium foliaceum, Strain CCMP 1326" /LENGTH=552 /DNA_ID=CAMNT_0017378383 /DNA_START=86 /DNA_END=1744 /DNA_ORIENTATION=-